MLCNFRNVNCGNFMDLYRFDKVLYLTFEINGI